LAQFECHAREILLICSLNAFRDAFLGLLGITDCACLVFGGCSDSAQSFFIGWL